MSLTGRYFKGENSPGTHYDGITVIRDARKYKKFAFQD